MKGLIFVIVVLFVVGLAFIFTSCALTNPVPPAAPTGTPTAAPTPTEVPTATPQPTATAQPTATTAPATATAVPPTATPTITPTIAVLTSLGLPTTTACPGVEIVNWTEVNILRNTDLGDQYNRTVFAVYDPADLRTWVAGLVVKDKAQDIERPKIIGASYRVKAADDKTASCFVLELAEAIAQRYGIRAYLLYVGDGPVPEKFTTAFPANWKMSTWTYTSAALADPCPESKRLEVIVGYEKKTFFDPKRVTRLELWLPGKAGTSYQPFVWPGFELTFLNLQGVAFKKSCSDPSVYFPFWRKAHADVAARDNTKVIPMICAPANQVPKDVPGLVVLPNPNWPEWGCQPNN